MVSDDTEQTCLVAQALIETGGDVERFRQSLLCRLRGWFLTLPGGIGLGTLRAMSKSLVGFPAHRCGVYSAGNGPAMRSTILGAAIDDGRLLSELVKASCTLTHTDPKALFGAHAVALAANLARRELPVDAHEYYAIVRDRLAAESANKFLQLLETVVRSVEQRQATPEFAIASGLKRGVSGFVYETVPVALHAWLTNQNDFRQAVADVVRCGGDADTTGSIVGGIVGCHVGRGGIPDDWTHGLVEWPRTVGWMEDLGTQLARVVTTGRPEMPISLPLSGVMLRNAAFLSVVLAHGLRRLLPPY